MPWVRAARVGSVTAMGRSSTRRGVGESLVPRELEKVVPVQDAAQAFAVQHRVVAHYGGHAAVGVDIREIQLAARLEQPQDSAQHHVLVRGEVDDAVGDDEVEALPLQPQGLQVLGCLCCA